MKNTEYKCLCCGWVGNEETLGIDTSKSKVSQDFEICPQCGSIDIQEIMQLEKLPA